MQHAFLLEDEIPYGIFKNVFYRSVQMQHKGLQDFTQDCCKTVHLSSDYLEFANKGVIISIIKLSAKCRTPF